MHTDRYRHSNWHHHPYHELSVNVLFHGTISISQTKYLNNDTRPSQPPFNLLTTKSITCSISPLYQLGAISYQQGLSEAYHEDSSTKSQSKVQKSLICFPLLSIFAIPCHLKQCILLFIHELRSKLVKLTGQFKLVEFVEHQTVLLLDTEKIVHHIHADGTRVVSKFPYYVRGKIRAFMEMPSMWNTVLIVNHWSGSFDLPQLYKQR